MFSTVTKPYLVTFFSQVLSTVDSDVQVRFLQSAGTDGEYTLPKKEDISWQSFSDIVKRLDKPTVLPGRGLKYKFNLSDLKMQKKFVFK